MISGERSSSFSSSSSSGVHIHRHRGGAESCNATREDWRQFFSYFICCLRWNKKSDYFHQQPQRWASIVWGLLILFSCMSLLIMVVPVETKIQGDIVPGAASPVVTSGFFFRSILPVHPIDVNPLSEIYSFPEIQPSVSRRGQELATKTTFPEPNHFHAMFVQLEVGAEVTVIVDHNPVAASCKLTLLVFDSESRFMQWVDSDVWGQIHRLPVADLSGILKMNPAQKSTTYVFVLYGDYSTDLPSCYVTTPARLQISVDTPMPHLGTSSRVPVYQPVALGSGDTSVIYALPTPQLAFHPVQMALERRGWALALALVPISCSLAVAAVLLLFGCFGEMVISWPRSLARP
ncbi:hypothetical protein H696_00058 [Fonticula alba]|uniref:Transmembrane protein n=1 Tax=Fonticula alba TaxID=691883 RepID=A0A058ZDK1_FONAL|nr:hypothetical protein H696_00058 [Fonticula alba]KCV72465.1 hypothetical protein H696_00058 [Fonticula alba]|eukprot:XP_009492166.1 hypothetical protein H696_00058 [Fonticula alba]